MAEAHQERRLAAILAADVVGYSRLIGADEAGTLNALRALRKELVEPALKRHHGRVVKLMGDGLLAEFASVVDAVAAAVEIQESMPDRSAHLAEDQRVALRIGVNIGDVVVEDGDLFGDGVNIAARLQEIADPNGVAISDGAASRAPWQVGFAVRGRWRERPEEHRGAGAILDVVADKYIR